LRPLVLEVRMLLRLLMRALSSLNVVGCSHNISLATVRFDISMLPSCFRLTYFKLVGIVRYMNKTSSVQLIQVLSLITETEFAGQLMLDLVECISYWLLHSA
jgi:hypothetical protein